MSQSNGNGWRSIALAALISVVITGTGAWFILGRDAVSRPEAERMVAANSVANQQVLQELKASIEQLSERVQNQGEQIARQGAILERVERVMDRAGPRVSANQ